MTIKLLLLKSGEDIIADVDEMSSGEGESRRVFGYFLNRPCVVKMHNPSVLGGSEDTQKKTSYQLTLYPWIPLSKEERIPVPADWIITITDPIDKLNQMYIEDVVNYGNETNQNISSTEQSNTSDSD